MALLSLLASDWLLGQSRQLIESMERPLVGVSHLKLGLDDAEKKCFFPTSIVAHVNERTSKLGSCGINTQVWRSAEKSLVYRSVSTRPNNSAPVELERHDCRSWLRKKWNTPCHIMCQRVVTSTNRPRTIFLTLLQEFPLKIAMSEGSTLSLKLQLPNANIPVVMPSHLERANSLGHLCSSWWTLTCGSNVLASYLKNFYPALRNPSQGSPLIFFTSAFLI